MPPAPPAGAPGSRKRRFRNFLINPRYQIKYVFWLTSTGFLLVGINASVFYGYIRENYDILVDMSPMDDAAKAQLYLELHQVVIKLGIISACFLLVVGIMGVVLSHRSAGPLYHFKRVFEAVTRGDRSARVRLRPKDDFQDVAASFNAMMDRLGR